MNIKLDIDSMGDYAYAVRCIDKVDRITSEIRIHAKSRAARRKFFQDMTDEDMKEFLFACRRLSEILRPLMSDLTPIEVKGTFPDQNRR